MFEQLERAPLPADGVPTLICADCADRALFHRATLVAIAYCEHSRTGAALPMDELPWAWHVTENIDAAAFQAQIGHELVAKGLLLEREASRAGPPN